jgi:hypothetical protein
MLSHRPPSRSTSPLHTATVQHEAMGSLHEASHNATAGLHDSHVVHYAAYRTQNCMAAERLGDISSSTGTANSARTRPVWWKQQVYPTYGCV